MPQIAKTSVSRTQSKFNSSLRSNLSLSARLFLGCNPSIAILRPPETFARRSACLFTGSFFSWPGPAVRAVLRLQIKVNHFSGNRRGRGRSMPPVLHDYGNGNPGIVFGGKTDKKGMVPVFILHCPRAEAFGAYDLRGPGFPADVGLLSV